MPLWSASTMTASPPTNMPVRQAGQGRAGCRRATLMTPQRYRPAAIMTPPVTSGADCHCVNTASKPNGGSMRPPSQRAYSAAWKEVAAVPGTTDSPPGEDSAHRAWPGLLAAGGVEYVVCHGELVFRTALAGIGRGAGAGRDNDRVAVYVLDDGDGVRNEFRALQRAERVSAAGDRRGGDRVGDRHVTRP